MRVHGAQFKWQVRAAVASGSGSQTENLQAALQLLRESTGKRTLAIISDNPAVTGLRLKGTGLGPSDYTIISFGTHFKPGDYCLVVSTSNTGNYPAVSHERLTSDLISVMEQTLLN